jgi:hypothetical protein
VYHRVFMGLEAECVAEWGGESGRGLAQLETQELLFRGAFRFKLPLAKVTAVVAREGHLEVWIGRKKAILHLGVRSERWAKKIQDPPTLADKLGIKEGMTLSFLGEVAPDVLAEIKGRRPRLVTPPKGAAVVLLFVTTKAELSRVSALRRSMPADGAIWIVWPKGRAELKEDDVREKGRAAGLVDVKVASVSERESGLKLVIPRASR